MRIDLFPKNLKNWFLTVSDNPRNLCLPASFKLNFKKPPCQVPPFSMCFGLLLATYCLLIGRLYGESFYGESSHGESPYGESIGSSPLLHPTFVGIPERPPVHLTAKFVEEIAEEIVQEEIAEVDIDPEAFDLPEDRPKPKKKDSLDEVEFISEREKPKSVGF